MGVVAGELIGRVLGGRFRLEALVGQGASGEVYLAVDTRLRRRVAVKVLHQAVGTDPQFLRRFRSEAQLASRLTHPNIVIIHDWHDGEPAHLITEFLDGGSLRTMLDRHHQLSLSQVVLIGIEAGRALAHAHGQGVVHRDIKPANVLFAADASLRIGDFGLARALAEAAHTEPEGAMVGTARYSSPEQLLGGPLDGRADVYSLVLVLIEAATGVTPFRADTPLGVLMARQRNAVVVPDSLGVLVEALTPGGTVNPEDRCDAATLVRRLERVTKHLPRPEPLPLVITVDVRSSALSDPTVHNGDQVVDLTLLPSLLPTLLPTLPTETFTGAAEVTVSIAETAGLHLVKPFDDQLVVAGGFQLGNDSTNQLADDFANEVGNDLKNVAGRESSEDPKRQSRFRLWVKRGLLGGLLALLVGAAGAGWMWWNNRPQWTTVPEVVNLSEVAATVLLQESQLVAAVATVFDETVPKDVVVGQQPVNGVKVEAGTEIDLTVSGGPAPRPVPIVVGLTEDAARVAATEAGLALTVTSIHDEVAVKGIVLDAQPANGNLPKGGTIDVIVSSGPAKRIVPNLSGMSVEQAKKALPSGLVGAVVEQFSETVAEGVVIAANYKPDSQLDRGAIVKILVSKGVAPVEVPATRGLDVVAATKRLKEAGFVVIATEGSPDQPVVATQPVAGRSVRRGSSVVIVTG